MVTARVGGPRSHAYGRRSVASFINLLLLWLLRLMVVMRLLVITVMLLLLRLIMLIMWHNSGCILVIGFSPVSQQRGALGTANSLLLVV